jgi:signal transduction histidine kinase
VKTRPSIADIALGLGLAIAAGVAANGAHSDLRPLLTVLAVGTGLSLALRCLYPVQVFWLTVVVTAFFALVYDGYWPFAAILAFYSVAAHTARRTAATAGLLGLLVLAWPIASVDSQPFSWSRVALVAGRLAPLVAAWALGDNVRTRRAYLASLEERAAQLERERDANARRAAAEEQARIAREVHDVVAHNLSVIVVQATAADRVFASDPQDARRAVQAIGTTARQALDELRRVLGVVRGDEQPVEFAPQPDLERLEGLLDQVRAAGLAVDLEVSGERRALSPALELSAYRIVQEALTNTLRHAGATHATVTLRYDADRLDVEVVDDGTKPADGNGSGHGLIGMRERAASFGGRVDAGPRADGGFRVSAELPLERV